jgi:hypothetical protein
VPVGPVGAPPQLALVVRPRFGPVAPLPVLVLAPVLAPLPPVVVPALLLLSLAPVGLAVVGTTAGTEVQALSKTTILADDWVGTEAAATENSRHLSALLTMPKANDWQFVIAVHWAWQDAAVLMFAGCEIGVWAPEAVGLEPQVARTTKGEAEARAKRLEAAKIVVNACMIAAGVFDWDI